MYELINADLDKRVVLNTEDLPWAPSPAPGVERKVLESLDTQTERVTTIVRFAPESYFPRHVHGGGEEFLVLEGVFSDEHGDYPAGSYLRNPPGSSHQPFTRDGCTILVKLWQFHGDDQQAVNIDWKQAHWRPGVIPGLTVLPLHEFDGVNTALVRWAPHTVFNEHTHPGGEEIFVISGTLHDEHGRYPQGSWQRNARWSRHRPFTRDEGALIYVRVGQIGASLIADPTASPEATGNEAQA